MYNVVLGITPNSWFSRHFTLWAPHTSSYVNEMVSGNEPSVSSSCWMQSLLDSAIDHYNASIDAPGCIASAFGWAPPLPRLLHCPVFLPTPT